VRAGFGAAAITPAPPVHLAGFGGRIEAVTSVHDDLEARTLYLEEDGVAVCIVVCDLLGMSPAYSRPVREAIAEATGLPIEGVLVACTHTHQGPSVMTGTDALGWPNPPGYENVLRDGCVASARAAVASAQDATLRYARAPLPDGFAFNRRGGAYDEPWFALLDVRTSDDSRIGVVANVGIHPVLLGPGWASVATDWVGPFRRELERLAGGAAIELTGALGDINPTPPKGEDAYKSYEKTATDPGAPYEPWASAEDTDAYGRKLAAVVAAALDDTQPLDATLAIVRSETEEIAVGGTGLSVLQGEPSMLVEFVEWSIGDVRLVSIPGEGFHLLGKEISASRDDRVLLAGISPSWHGYLPHPWGEGYEEGVSFGKDAVAAMRSKLLERPPG
jgi:hypothetical protein